MPWAILRLSPCTRTTPWADPLPALPRNIRAIATSEVRHCCYYSPVPIFLLLLSLACYYTLASLLLLLLLFHAVARSGFSPIRLAKKEWERSSGTHGPVQRRTHDGTSICLEIAPFLLSTGASRCGKHCSLHSFNNGSLAPVRSPGRIRHGL